MPRSLREKFTHSFPFLGLILELFSYDPEAPPSSSLTETFLAVPGFILMKFSRLVLSVSILCVSLAALAQRPGGGPPPMRKHTATKAETLVLVPATEQAPTSSSHEFTRTESGLVVSSNGIPEHPVGMFPNRGNPHTIQPQGYEIVLPSDPKPAAAVTKMERTPFGIALNGVFLDPGAAEYWQGEPERGWQYEALGGAVPLGLDEHQAHVQPSGAYHYHGIPESLAKRLGLVEGKHSPQVGWAADGFPIYVRIGLVDPRNSQSEVTTLKSSWRLKSGTRPDGTDGPGGTFDGAFVQDYEFIEGSGDLDECNGRFCITPEFPEGTYAYFLTDEWPVIPRAFRGTPIRLRMEGPPGGPRPDRGR